MNLTYCANPNCGSLIVDLHHQEVVKDGHDYYCCKECEKNQDNPPEQEEKDTPQTRDGQLLLDL